jgi:hypothetical protein
MILFILAIALLSALVWIGYNYITDYLDYKRLLRNGYRKLAARRYRRGFVARDAMRGFAEFGLLILLLIAVLGWMGFR